MKKEVSLLMTWQFVQGIVFLCLSLALGTLCGAIGGELVDQIPYFSHIVPEWTGHLIGIFTSEDTGLKFSEMFVGNLDKIGAVLGFFGGMFIIE